MTDRLHRRLAYVFVSRYQNLTETKAWADNDRRRRDLRTAGGTAADARGGGGYDTPTEASDLSATSLRTVSIAQTSGTPSSSDWGRMRSIGERYGARLSVGRGVLREQAVPGCFFGMVTGDIVSLLGLSAGE